MCQDELKKIDEIAKKYEWKPKFTLEEKIKVIIKPYLSDYEDRELTKDDFIKFIAGKIANLVYLEKDE